MSAIYKRELRSYFTTPIGYIFLSVFMLFSGILFCYSTLFSMSGDISTYFTVMPILITVLLPLLTMKLFCEEKKQKTEQLLMTAPISIISMVTAKFLAAYTLYAGAVAVSSLSFIILYFYAQIQTATLIGSVFALLLVGGAFVAVGVFVSSITESQLAAAVITVAILAVMMFISLINSFIDVYFIRFIFNSVAIYTRFRNFTQGVFDISALFYYLSVCAVFLFLTVCVYDKRRWE
ncbi:MAG: ABC transporter permease subunit [Eubacteriales bacterium]|nr:ABC transporter permease subunit [Eubacteriales bacterium]